MADRAYVVTGAVIVSDDMKSQVKYHPQCPYCGDVMFWATSSASVSQGIKANLGVYTCSKCGKSFQTRINRGC